MTICVWECVGVCYCVVHKLVQLMSIWAQGNRRSRGIRVGGSVWDKAEGVCGLVGSRRRVGGWVWGRWGSRDWSPFRLYPQAGTGSSFFKGLRLVFFLTGLILRFKPKMTYTNKYINGNLIKKFIDKWLVKQTIFYYKWTVLMVPECLSTQ